MKFKRLRNSTLFTLLMLGFIMVSCGESDYAPKPFVGEPADPSKPVKFSDFNPKDGAMRTKIFIDGENFGTDVSKILVSIGGADATVIGSDGQRIYCVVPPRAYDGAVKTTILKANGDTLVTHQFDSLFTYVKTTSVSTLVGKVDGTDNVTSIVNGTFEEAEFEEPWWLQFDRTAEGEEHLYVLERQKALRRVDITNRQVSTVFTNGQGMFRILMTFTFDSTRDTLFFTDDHGQNNKNLTALSYAVRRENFRNVYPYVYDRTTYSCAVNPINNDLYYNTWWDGSVAKARGKVDPTTGEREADVMFSVSTNGNAHTYLTMHPDGFFCYITGNFKCIFKSPMVTNPETGFVELARMQPEEFVGKKNSGGYDDAAGSQARFQNIRQGVFVKNPDYVRDGKKDIYDFYVIDDGNHCIRIITPEGFVSTFAGRGSPGLNNNKWGYIDGDLRSEARFRDPSGIAYDEETQTFYIADKNNKRIRMITVQ